MKHLSLTIFIVLKTLSLSAQLNDDFSGDLSLWQGSEADFIINEDQRLQLNADSEGQSFFYTTVEFPDSLEWTMDVELQFPPSVSNRLDLWLAMDNPDPAMATGFLLSVGETGSDDALKFHAVENGNKTLLAEGVMGQVADDFRLIIQITKNGNDLWTLKTKTPSSVVFDLDFELSYPAAFFPSAGYFGMDCTYTSGRADLFFFDDVSIMELVADEIAPSVTEVSVENSQKIVVTYDEILDENTVTDRANYDLPVSVSSVSSDPDNPTSYCLNLVENLPSGQEFDLTISGVTDVAGNEMSAISFSLAVAENPIAGDLRINEILYNPFTGNSADFVELINNSDKFIKLDAVYLTRERSTAVDVQLPMGIVLQPEEIIAFTPDVEEIIDTYSPINDFNLQELKINNYVQGSGNASIKTLIDNITTMIDSFDYDDDLHSPLLTSSGVKGISLERISASAPTNDVDNWYSAASSVNFATPGYTNSQVSRPDNENEEPVFLEEKVFSPDGDGYQDLLRINYQLDKVGYIANANVYDDRGRLETNIASNKLLGQQGTLLWDGFLDDGELAPIGMYILHYNFFHNDGEVISGKKVFVLAQRLD